MTVTVSHNSHFAWGSSLIGQCVLKGAGRCSRRCCTQNRIQGQRGMKSQCSNWLVPWLAYACALVWLCLCPSRSSRQEGGVGCSPGWCPGVPVLVLADGGRRGVPSTGGKAPRTCSPWTSPASTLHTSGVRTPHPPKEHCTVLCVSVGVSVSPPTSLCAAPFSLCVPGHTRTAHAPQPPGCPENCLQNSEQGAVPQVLLIYK